MGRTIKPAAFAGLAALLGTQNGVRATDKLDVVNPGAVVLDRAFTLEWGSIGEERFDVKLYPNSGSCEGSDPVDLCGKSNGCLDSKGDLNVVVPMSAGEGEREYPMGTAASI